MNNYWFVSDHHFGHNNIIKYSNRPFSSVEEMNEMLIDNWNNQVKNNDFVYFLGDFAYKSRDAALAIRKRLNGVIHFIEGNHDSAAWQIRDTFAWYSQVKKVCVFGQEIFLSHYAHRVWNKCHHGVWHLYGHSHASLPDDPQSLSFDVGVDNTAIRLSGSELYGTGKLPSREILFPQDYRPINFEEVKAIMNNKNFRAIDHHGKDREAVLA